jgi:dTDP-4-dehydrorhamnose reductase
MNVLLFGAKGQVGTACKKTFESLGWNVTALTRNEIDFCLPDTVYEAVKNTKSNIVVNACAYTAVDKAESEPEIANLVNAKSVGAIGKACHELNIPVVHLSTDYVFNGSANAPYKEIDAIAPLGVYGKSKFEGEQLLQQKTEQHIILRTSWVFSAVGNNFVKTMLRLGVERDELKIVGDQLGCPTYAGDIAEAIASIITLIEKDQSFSGWGLYNCSNAGDCSWYDFACAIFKTSIQHNSVAKTPKVKSITTDQYPTATARPAYSVLDCSKLEALIGKSMPNWQQGLSAVCAELCD